MLRGFVLVCALSAACSQASGSGPTPAPQDLEWVALDGGCFTMGETRVYPEEAPMVEACVTPFALTRTEVTTAQFAAFVAETGYRTRAERGWRADDPDGPGVDVPPGAAVFSPPAGVTADLSWWRFAPGASWRDGEPNHPVVHVTREDAEAFAAWAGGRLPSEAEWEYAARGGVDGALMAWDEAEAVALTDRANTWQGVFPVVNTAKDGHAGLAPVGTYPANGFGLVDMIGNAWEWTASPYYHGHAPTRSVRTAHPAGHDPDQPEAGAVGVIKGGSFLCARSYCYRFRPAARQAQDLAFATSHIGFRIAR